MDDTRVRIRKLLDIHKMPYTYVADKIGYKSYYRFHGFMTGNNKSINHETLCDLADLFGVSTDYLFGRCELDENYERDIEKLYMKSFEKYIRHSSCPLKAKKRYIEEYEETVIAPWPYNLLDAMHVEFLDIPAPDKAIEALYYVMKRRLTYREYICTYEHYRLGRTYDDIGEEHDLSRERIRQIVAKAVRKLRHPSSSLIIKHGIGFQDEIDKKYEAKRKAYIEACAAKRLEREKESLEYEWSKDDTIDCLNLSVRSYNCLKKAGIETVKDLLDIVENDPLRLYGIRNLGSGVFSDIMKCVGAYKRGVKNERISV